ncbi:MAG: hypothetical protein KDK89_08630 [Alphaproteobacteria bacterium]|nr:hypothetical protein [Alphaproteobacteria bacterium]
MKRGVIASMRRRQGHWSLVLTLAMVLPLLLGLLPSVSSEAQLLRDIAASRCYPLGNGPQEERRSDHDGCCILCPSGASASVVLDGKDAASLIPRRAVGLADNAIPLELPARRRVDLVFIAPRGPPAI